MEDAKKGTVQVAPQAVQPKAKQEVKPVKTGLTQAELETKKAVQGLIRLDGQEKRWYEKNPKTVDKELNVRVKGKAKERAPIIAEEMQGWVKTKVVPAKTSAPALGKQEPVNKEIKPAEKKQELLKKEDKPKEAPKPRALELTQLPGVKAEIIERTYKWYHYIPIIGWAAILLDLGVKKTTRETKPSEQLRDLGLQQYVALKPFSLMSPSTWLPDVIRRSYLRDLGLQQYVALKPFSLMSPSTWLPDVIRRSYLINVDERATLKNIREKTPDCTSKGKAYFLTVIGQGSDERIVAIEKSALNKK